MAIKVNIDPSWAAQLNSEFAKPYFMLLTDFVKQAYQEKTIYPAGRNIFRAFDLCPFDKVKVVILGQDPYHGPGQAEGLCFSVPKGVKIPPSLVNIFQEQARDLRKPFPSHGNLAHWAAQGVLLLNATLTVEARKAGSHQNKGWEVFTDAVVKQLSDQKKNLVFMLWGAYAQSKGTVIDTSRHLVLSSSHPSPFSVNRGFLGCGHFGKANTYLQSYGHTPIKW
ncbi:MAG: uracil-DNA glycosylase [Bacteroidota bacterium]